MAEPTDLVLPLLREIQADLAAFRKETGERLEKLEDGQRGVALELVGSSLQQEVRELEARK